MGNTAGVGNTERVGNTAGFNTQGLVNTEGMCIVLKGVGTNGGVDIIEGSGY